MTSIIIPIEGLPDSTVGYLKVIRPKWWQFWKWPKRVYWGIRWWRWRVKHKMSRTVLRGGWVRHEGTAILTAKQLRKTLEGKP